MFFLGLCTNGSAGYLMQLSVKLGVHCPPKVSYSYSFGYDRLQKMQILFVGKCLKIGEILHGGDRRHILCQKDKN